MTDDTFRRAMALVRNGESDEHWAQLSSAERVQAIYDAMRQLDSEYAHTNNAGLSHLGAAELGDEAGEENVALVRSAALV